MNPIDPKILTAGDAIADTIGKTMLSMQSRLCRKYHLTGQQLAAAYVHAEMLLLAGSVAGIACGAGATMGELQEAAIEILSGLQPVVGAAVQNHNTTASDAAAR